MDKIYDYVKIYYDSNFLNNRDNTRGDFYYRYTDTNGNTLTSVDSVYGLNNIKKNLLRYFKTDDIKKLIQKGKVQEGYLFERDSYTLERRNIYKTQRKQEEKSDSLNIGSKNPVPFRYLEYDSKKEERRRFVRKHLPKVITITFISGIVVYIVSSYVINKEKRFSTSNIIRYINPTDYKVKIDSQIKSQYDKAFSILSNMTLDGKVSSSDIDYLVNYFYKVSIANNDNNRSFYLLNLFSMISNNQMGNDIARRVEQMHNAIFLSSDGQILYNNENAYHYLLYVTNLFMGGDNFHDVDANLLTRSRGYSSYKSSDLSEEEYQEKCKNNLENLVKLQNRDSEDKIRYSATKEEARAFSGMSSLSKIAILSELRGILEKNGLDFQYKPKDLPSWWHNFDGSYNTEKLLNEIDEAIANLSEEIKTQYSGKSR